MLKFYPVCIDDLSIQERASLKPLDKIRAKETGEFRRPKRGEWYLSGADPTAFKAFL